MLDINNFTWVSTGYDSVCYVSNLDKSETLLVMSNLNHARYVWLELISPWFRKVSVKLDNTVGYIVPTMKLTTEAEAAKDPICATFMDIYRSDWDCSVNEFLLATEKTKPDAYRLVYKYRSLLSNTIPKQELDKIRIDAHKDNFLKYKSEVIPWDMWVSDHRPWQSWE